MKKGLIVVLLLCLAFAGFAEGGSEANEGRTNTIYATGGMYSPPGDFNPINWSFPSALRGLTFEPLFMYDPIENVTIPWLAESYEWQGEELVINLRTGAKFSDGTDVTPEDVQFSITYPSWSQVWQGVEEAIIEGNSLRIIFADMPSYHGSFNNLITWPVVKKAFWEAIDPNEATSTVLAPEDAIGSGPYTVAGFDQDRVFFERNDNWWGKSALGIDFPAKNIVYLLSMGNSVVAQLLQQGVELDMANNFMPGIGTLKAQFPHIHTWYQSAPYHIPDNVVYMIPNVTVKPLDDPEFRKALAYAANTAEAIEIAYENSIVGTNASGILEIPSWAPYKNQDLIDQYGFTFDPAKAAAMLDAAGYVDADGDGWRDNKDGSPIELKFSVPIGYTDFKDAVDILTDSFIAVGLNILPDNPDENKWMSDAVKGEFDITLYNWASGISHSPWTMYNGLFSSYAPVGSDDWSGNWGRYTHEDISDLIAELDATPMSDTAACNAIVRKIQTILLTEMPAIPLYTNSMWFVANTKNWTNWPGQDTDSKAYPSTFTDKMQIGGLMMFANLKPAQ